MSTIRCQSAHPESCRSGRCPNKTGRATSKFARLTPVERHPFTERGIAEAEATRVDAKLKTKHDDIRALVAEFYA